MSVIGLYESRQQHLAMAAYAKAQGLPYSEIADVGTAIISSIPATLVVALFVIPVGLLVSFALMLPTVWLSEQVSRYAVIRIALITAVGVVVGYKLLPLLMYGDRPDLEGGQLIARTLRDGAVVGGLIALTCAIFYDRSSGGDEPVRNDG